MIKKITPEKFTVYIFLIVIMSFFSMTFVQAGRKITAKLISPKKPAELAVRSIDWAELYPFDFTETEEDAKHEEQESRLMRSFNYFKGRIEDYTNGFNRVRIKLVESARKYEDLIGWNMAYISGYNPVIKLHDGYLAGMSSSKDITENAGRLIDLAGYCRNNEIDFFYVNIPSKVCRYEDSDISGILDFLNQNADKFLELLGKSGVKYYDLREILHKEGMNHHEAFFVTDHHWKPEAGLWAARHILEFLRDDYGWDTKPELLNPDKFKRVVYPEWFLGSQGKKVTLSRTRPDDFTLMYPEYKVSLNYEVPVFSLNLSGDFSIMYYMKNIEEKDYYNKNTYYTYGRSDYDLGKTTNFLSENGRKVLVIKDSFMRTLAPFLALGVSQLDELDIRSFNGSVRNYISSTRPDAVIVCYTSSMPGKQNMFKFR